MVGLGGVGCDHNEDPAHCEEVVDDCPPRVGGEAISGLDLGDDGCDESNNPCELGDCQPTIHLNLPSVGFGGGGEGWVAGCSSGKAGLGSAVFRRGGRAVGRLSNAYR